MVETVFSLLSGFANIADYRDLIGGTNGTTCNSGFDIQDVVVMKLQHIRVDGVTGRKLKELSK